MSLWGVFVTGLLAGGASCALVQGGLLAGLLAKRKGVPAAKQRGSKKAAAAVKSPPAFRGEDLVPVTGFLVGKLVSHTILGGFLGILGASFQVSFRTQALMLLGAGAVMVVMALDLLGVQAVKGLVPTVPPSWSALVRRRAGSSSALAPTALGFATVLIPCGITLSMELLAITSGSPITGALIMGVFVLGTSPLFAAFGYLIRRASARGFGNAVAKAAAVAVLFMALVTINSGLVLSGSPLNFRQLSDRTDSTAAGDTSSVTFSGEPGAPAPDPSSGAGVQTIAIKVGGTGYSPGSIEATAGLPTRLVLTTSGTRGCTRAFVIPELRIQKILPETGRTEIDIGSLRKGTLDFTCSMGMFGGEINFT